MKVLVDTSIWSEALRKNADRNNGHCRELLELVHELRVVIIGPIRQEVLSGISDPRTFEQLKEKLKAFEDIPLETEHFELAAEFFNRCRKKGIQGSHIDFLICAVGSKNTYPIYTADRDFEKYKQHIDITLYHPRKVFPGPGVSAHND